MISVLINFILIVSVLDYVLRIGNALINAWYTIYNIICTIIRCLYVNCLVDLYVYQKYIFEGYFN